MNDRHECLLASRDVSSFNEFVSWSECAQRAFPSARSACETRIAKAYAAIRPQVTVCNSHPTVHRCDLVWQWRGVRNVPVGISQIVLACEGVRHGLAIIFEMLAKSGSCVALPRDVYPVYWRLASDVGLRTVSFETFADLDLRSVLDSLRRSGAQILVLPCPLKLHGRLWTEDETALVEKWLAERPERRLILDGVYSFGLPMDAATRHLIATDQVIYLDSLSKGWLHERVFGVAIIPARDERTYAGRFRSERPNQSNLFLAQELLSQFRDFPSRLAAQIDDRRSALFESLISHRARPAERGYFVAVEASATELLGRHSLIAIPASVFGSSLRDWSIASALPRAIAP